MATGMHEIIVNVRPDLQETNKQIYDDSRIPHTIYWYNGVFSGLERKLLPNATLEFVNKDGYFSEYPVVGIRDSTGEYTDEERETMDNQYRKEDCHAVWVFVRQPDAVQPNALNCAVVCRPKIKSSGV
jgi:hypothetical protein